MSTDPHSLPRTLGVVMRGIADKLHIGAQVYASVSGQIVADFAVGESRPGVAMTTDTLMIWMSCTKPVTAVAVARLWERGLFDLDDPVAQFIPEFGQKGKESITLRHILTHTGGFRPAGNSWKPVPSAHLVAEVCNARLEPGWIPGKKAGYHAASSWIILGELVHRLDGRPFDRYVREEIFLPLEMSDSWIGMPIEQYRAYGERHGIMQVTDTGTPTPHPYFDIEANADVIRPGASGHGPARELGRFYEMMLGRGQLPTSLPLPPGEAAAQAAGEGVGGRILTPQTVEAMMARQRVGMFDESFKHVIDWGLGFIVNSARYGEATVPYGLGPYASERTFGHGGSQSSVSFADPEKRLAAAIIFNGTPGEAKHDRRLRETLAALYEDLGLDR